MFQFGTILQVFHTSSIAKFFCNLNTVHNKRTYINNHIFTSKYSDIHIVGAGYERSSSKKEPLFYPDFKQYSMHYVLSGAGYLEYEGKTFYIEKDSVFFFIPGSPIRYYPDKKRPWQYAWINFVGTKVSEFLTRLRFDMHSPVIAVKNKNLISRLFLQNATECLNYPDFSDIIVTASFYKILAELFKERDISADIVSSDTSHVNKALNFINENYINPDLNIKIAASHIGINESYLSRLIKKTTGVTFTDYLARCRMNAAILLMDKGETSIKAIADKVGFSSQYYFSSVFKKYQTISPREHLKSLNKS